jgi:transposase
MDEGERMNTTPHMAPAQPRVWIGIDVSHATLDVCVLRPDSTMHDKQFANIGSGYKKLVRWVEQLAPHCVHHYCLEATGSYSIAVAEFLANLGYAVSIVNPARMRFFGLAQGHGNKTDQTDARLIARFCHKDTPALWRAASPEMRLLLALIRRVQAVQPRLVQEKNRRAAPHQPAEVIVSLQMTISFLEQEVTRVRGQIRVHVQPHQHLKQDVDLLQSIPGIGEVAAWTILAELPDVSQFDSAQRVAAYAGLAPREYRSGSSVRKQTRLHKHGNSRLRKAVYFPAVSAVVWNPVVKAHDDRLRQAGKAKMVALAAAMRKLLMICYGVLKHQQPFQADWCGCPRRAHSGICGTA